MTAKFFAILTNQGAAALANATALGTRVDLTHIAVGDGGGVLPTPDPAQTALKGEKRRAAINMLIIDPGNDSQITAEQIIPENEGGWWIREIGLFSADGTLIAVANCPETYKPQLQEGSGRTQTIRMVLIVSSTEAVTLKIDPATVLATRDYVDGELKKHAGSRNHPDATLTAQGFVQLSSATNSTSETQAATPKAVKAVNDAALKIDKNLSDLTNKSAARGNLALGAAATRNVGTDSSNLMEVGAFGLGGSGLRLTGDAVSSPVKLMQYLKTIGSQVFRVGGGYAGIGSDVPAIYLKSGDVHAVISVDYINGIVKTLACNDERLAKGNVATNTLYGTANPPNAADINALDRTDCPVGIPQPWPTATPPAGWLKCNGANFDKDKYPLLAVAYPSGKLPDLRGEFIRGADDGRGVDSSRAVLSAQADAVQKFTGKTNGIQHFIPGLSTEGIIAQGQAVASTSGLTETSGGTGNGVFRVEIDASRQIRTAAETRPRNIAFNYIVRAA
jgi:hypothetical protein